MLELDRFARLGAQRSVFLNQLVALGATPHGVQQFFGRKRLAQIIDGSGSYGVHRHARGGVRGDHQDGQLRMAFLGRTQKFVAAHAAEPGVGDDHEELLLAQDFERFLGRLDGFGDEAFVRKHRGERKTHVSLVVHNQQWGQLLTHDFNRITVRAGNFRVKRVPFPSSDSTSTEPP